MTNKQGRLVASPRFKTIEKMKVRLKRTGQLLDVQEARAKYWIKIGYATLVEEMKTTPEPGKPKKKIKKAVLDEPTKKAEKEVEDENKIEDIQNDSNNIEAS